MALEFQAAKIDNLALTGNRAPSNETVDGNLLEIAYIVYLDARQFCQHGRFNNNAIFSP